MDFLKKHYEKIILAFFLLAFVLLLVYLIDLSNSTTKITRSSLEIPVIEPNYEPNDFSHKKYQTSYIFRKNCTWNKSKARSDNDQIFTDLLIPFECARCPFGGKVIPLYYFFGPVDKPRHCPLCNKALPRPKVKPKGPDIVNDSDLDDDGIPNVIETKLGLDPENPDDALYDLDNDGFSNIFEFQQKTNIKSAIKHPPMYMRLHLLEFRETLLPFKLMLVNTNGGKKDPADWVIQINKMIKGKSKTLFMYLGDPMTLDKTPYTITKIDAIHVDVRSGGSIVKKDKSKVFLKSRDGKYTIIMQVDEPVYSPKPKAVIEDLGTGKMYHVGTGDTISMYLRTKPAFSKKTGRKLKRRITRYKVFKVDRQKKQVIIEDKKRKNKKYILSAKAFMPRVKREEKADNQGAENPGRASESIDAPPGGAPPVNRQRKATRNF
ncbi:MAG: hypothetical protein KOO69_05615 [Victivallales bacterium]|nr:hypothetical protein [Victivallales bacterium]